MLFSFGRESEVRYIAGVPQVGDHVSHGKELWLVSEVDVDGVGTYVICEQPREARVSSIGSPRDSPS